MVADTFYFYDTFMTLVKFSEKRIVEQLLRFQWGSIFVIIRDIKICAFCLTRNFCWPVD